MVHFNSVILSSHHCASICSSRAFSVLELSFGLNLPKDLQSCKQQPVCLVARPDLQARWAPGTRPRLPGHAPPGRVRPESRPALGAQGALRGDHVSCAPTELLSTLLQGGGASSCQGRSVRGAGQASSRPQEQQALSAALTCRCLSRMLPNSR